MSLRFRVLGSGSTGNATLVEGEGVRILIDAGLGPRELAERLQSVGVDPASVDAIFLSHEHQDHFDIKQIKEIIARNPEVVVITHEAVGIFE